MKNKRGITLVALIITIIVLLILAGVVISMTVGNDGIITKAQGAVDTYKNAQEQEENMLNTMLGYMGGTTSTGSPSGQTGNATGTGGSASSSRIINDFTPTVTSKTGTTIDINASASTNNGTNIKAYIYLLEGKYFAISENSNFKYTGLTKNTPYNISVIAIDEDGNFKKSTVKTESTLNATVARYLVFEIDDSISETHYSYINEISVIKGASNLSYSVVNAYDSSTQSTPLCWDDAGWNKSNLNDEAISFTSNYPDAYQNCTGFLDGSLANSNNFARFIIDLGEEKEIDDVKIALGGALDYIPKSVSCYILNTSSYVSGTGTGSTYDTNLKGRNDTNLTLLHTEEFSSVVTTPTWYSFTE